MKKNNLTFKISMVSRVIWITVIALCLSCANSTIIDNVDVSCLFVNKKNEEILIRQNNNDDEIIICFLEAEEQYLWALKTSIKIQGMSNEDTISIKFNFYVEGTKGNFTEYIGEYTLITIVCDGCVYLDTCHVY